MAAKLFVVTFLALSVSLASGFMGFSLDGKINLHREPIETKADMDTRLVETKWVEQLVDNFDASNTDTWEMRYMENAEFFVDGGPIYIFVGGEWTISPGSILYGHMVDMARDSNGLMFYTEHRYYGSSFPTEDISTENLRYLNVDQALADLAHFINFVHSDYPGAAESQVILVGGSYSATMVTWFQQSYPGVAVGVWSSSAPLYAKVDYYEYKEVVGYSMRLLGGDLCYGYIEEGFATVEDYFLVDDFAAIESVFNLCNPLVINSEMDKWWFFDTLTEVFSGLVQYHSGNQIVDACQIITSAPSPMEGVAAYIDYMYNGGCLSSNYTEFIEYYSQTSIDSGAARSSMRQWLYQTCSEYGWYQSSNSTNQPFGQFFPAELYVRACADMFGSDFTPEQIHANVDSTNAAKGGLYPEVENVFSTHGQLDPWRAMGTYIDLNESSPTRIIANASHCADLSSISEYDNEEMLAAKLHIQSLVWSWIGLDTK